LENRQALFVICAILAEHVSDAGTLASTAVVTGADAQSAAANIAAIYATLAVVVLNAGPDVIRSVLIAEMFLLQ